MRRRSRVRQRSQCRCQRLARCRVRFAWMVVSSFFCRPYGTRSFLRPTQGLRPGLHSLAPSRLNVAHRRSGLSDFLAGRYLLRRYQASCFEMSHPPTLPIAIPNQNHDLPANPTATVPATPAPKRVPRTMFKSGRFIFHSPPKFLPPRLEGAPNRHWNLCNGFEDSVENDGAYALECRDDHSDYDLGQNSEHRTSDRAPAPMWFVSPLMPLALATASR